MKWPSLVEAVGATPSRESLVAAVLPSVRPRAEGLLFGCLALRPRTSFRGIIWAIDIA